MLKRALILCISLWLMIAGGLAAHAGPCHPQAMEAQPAIAAPAITHAHCDMMGDKMAAHSAPSEAPAPEMPEAPAPFCCCPAVMAALPAPAAPDAGGHMFRIPASFPLDASAPSRTLIPEPPPPKHLV
ncbi:hypothetical protein [Hyphomonas sp.]|uniref:hypothetical protein n=1 Tax=Hyphomonas sp. TaxID=87 RepID=UPI003919DF8A